jgi:hypothetical protein
MTADRSAATAEEFAARFAPFDAAPAAEESAVERVARAIWEADAPDVRWNAIAADSWIRSRYRRLAVAAIGAMRPAPDAPRADQGALSCHSRGPRIGSEGVPLCRLPMDHTGQHRPAPEDGWGAISWGGPR